MVVVKVTSITSRFPGGKVSPTGMVRAIPSRPVSVWLLLIRTVAPFAPGPAEAPAKVSREVLKFKLKPRAVSLPLAVTTTGTITLEPPRLVTLRTRTVAGGKLTISVALLLVKDPAELVTTTAYVPALER